MITSGMTYKIDWFAVFIFLGIVQAIFLSFFFFSTENRKKQFNLFYGWFLVSIVACLLEIFLMYTGYIIHVLYLVDFSETFGLLIGPFLYLFVLSIAKGPVQWKKIRIHLLFPCIYTFLILPYLLSSEDIKYNAWISSYHPGLPYRQVELSHIPIRFWLTDWHTELVLLSLGVYIVLSGIVIFRSFQEKNESFWRPVSLSLRTMRNGVIQIGAFTILIVIVKLFNEDDTGDHLFAAFGSLLIYVTSISVMRNSGFFKQATLTEAEKYKSSTLTPGQQQSILHKFNQVMQEQKPYLKSSFSLPDLAQQLGVSVHALSQALNHGLGKSFFELVAGYRVEEAKRLLIEQPNIKVEEIAEQVGYNSKSSFNTAFKKFTGSTPSAFREKNS
jgi:AraC-like DNA-binding protein